MTHDAKMNDAETTLRAKGETHPQNIGRREALRLGALGAAAAVEELARARADIALFDIATPRAPHVPYPLATEADLAEAKERVEALGVRCLTFKGYVHDFGARAQAMAATVETFGSLDIVLANAGVSQAGRIEGFSGEDISTVFEVNVAGEALARMTAEVLDVSYGSNARSIG